MKTSTLRQRNSCWWDSQKWDGSDLDHIGSTASQSLVAFTLKDEAAAHIL